MALTFKCDLVMMPAVIFFLAMLTSVEVVVTSNDMSYYDPCKYRPSCLKRWCSFDALWVTSVRDVGLPKYLTPFARINSAEASHHGTRYIVAMDVCMVPGRC
ncbi:hypothetical protein Bpfe_028378 [Biomphalaria pfeifferi]|uniref:Uncharacterized protein n=1 Tax=Biomphalaria pfeifferi TaxID=112525 RepID=A0AAD8ATN7_BIOPF|nr:hypothetical protein Bpfe_028378 [Biomphalaria pfeifferi]